jgi:polyisoprenoid-binding protein YceI
MFKILVLLTLGLVAFGSNLNIQKGEIIAHTEVFGDSKIDPSTKEINSLLVMNDNVESIKGKIYFDTISLISQKKDRDANMYELLNVEKYKTISFEITNIVKNETNYAINGVLILNGVKKNITSKSEIISEKDLVSLNGGFSFNLTDFNLEPPTLLFLTVRNQIDISYNIVLNKVK